jgi:hypothetical protein
MTETDPISEMMCSLEYRTTDKVQKPINSERYTPSSEPFRLYKFLTILQFCVAGFKSSIPRRKAWWG